MPKRLINEIRLSEFGNYQYWEEIDHVASFRDVAPDSPEYFQWLSTLLSFRFAGREGHFTARRETRQRGGDYWSAYRRQGKQFSVYLGTTDKLTLAHLESTAKHLTTLCSTQQKNKATRKRPIARATLMARIAEKDKMIEQLQDENEKLREELTTVKVKNAKLMVANRERQL
jgi:LuxR family transcriptional regulator, maltose regulon positive regulatory protein